MEQVDIYLAIRGEGFEPHSYQSKIVGVSALPRCFDEGWDVYLLEGLKRVYCVNIKVEFMDRDDRRGHLDV